MNFWATLAVCLSLCILSSLANSIPNVPPPLTPRKYSSLTQALGAYGLRRDVEVGKVLRFSSSTHKVELASEGREITVDGARTYLCFPIIFQHDQPLISNRDIELTLEPRFCAARCQGVAHFSTVVIDAGHGGADYGAIGPFGSEKDYTLDIVRRIRPYLVAIGLKVVLTRDSDEFIPLEERAEIANGNRDSIFVSVHFNAAQGRSPAQGCEIYTLTPHDVSSSSEIKVDTLTATQIAPGEGVMPASVVLAGCVQHSVVGHIGDCDRGIKRARFEVLRLTTLPSILIECGFLTNQTESKQISANDWRAKIAHAIAMGIINYRNVAELGRPPLTVADFRRLSKK